MEFIILVILFGVVVLLNKKINKKYKQSMQEKGWEKVEEYNDKKGRFTYWHRKPFNSKPNITPPKRKIQ